MQCTCVLAYYYATPWQAALYCRMKERHNPGYIAVLNKMHTALFITLLFRSARLAHIYIHIILCACCAEEIAVHKLMKYFNNSKDVWPDYTRAELTQTFYIKPVDASGNYTLIMAEGTCRGCNFN